MNTIRAVGMQSQITSPLRGAMCLAKDTLSLLCDVPHSAQVISRAAAMTLPASQVIARLVRATHASTCLPAISQVSSISSDNSRPDIIFIVDERARVTFVTPSVRRVLGIPHRAVIGTQLAEFAHSADVLNVRHFCRDLAEDAQLTGPVEWRSRGREGSWCRVEVTGLNLLYEDSVCGLLLNVRNITASCAVRPSSN